jgi:hypothetical protein
MKTILQYAAVLSALLLFPSGIHAQLLRQAEDLFAKGEYESALTVYEAAKIVEKDSLSRIEARMATAQKCLKVKNEADRRYENGDCENALTTYRSLLSENPSDRHAVARIADCEEQIKRRKENLFWTETKEKDTKEAFLDYLEKYPKGSHAGEANRRLAELDDRQWDAITPETPDSVLLAYLDEYPGGRHVDEARRRLADADDRRWLDAAQERNEVSFLAYLQNYPRGRHADEARRCIIVLAEDRLWREAKEENTERSYRDYLSASYSRTHEREAEKELERIEETRRQTETVSRAEEYLRAREYEKALTEIRKVNPDALPPVLREAARSCLEESEYHAKVKPSSSRRILEEYLKKYPGSPYRAEMEAKIRKIETEIRKIEAKGRRKELWDNSKPFPMIGLGIKLGGFNLISYTFPLYLTLRNEYGVVEFRTGIEYTRFGKNYDLEFSSDKNYDGNGYEITAHQLSIPATLKLVPSPEKRFYLSFTGTYNYNYQGKCFGRHNKKFVNGITHSGIIAIGCKLTDVDEYSGADLELFLREDFQPLFAGRGKIYEYDNLDKRNDYKIINKAINNTMIIGLALIVYFGRND